ncbi:MAG: 1-acyl-sn-glycerol-3-phosphate acyltransferase [Candidatus Eisenbacteria bacterium]|uniref:1-acyl-sn-glycerol-3-phosphate acyltransferase n=1 Tax=Eiseniibacteriota bacterium TaxID=2212470 RepID=A0A9D6L735_UNCEI|nr:1-acyl-sn-glycerol-3-phosphate acyltransferase [Candidatus Eisenbacteria bacterium]
MRGRKHVPLHGGVIVASNHASYFDPPLLACAAPREVHFLAKEELFRIPAFGALIRSVNAIPIRRGVADLSGLSRATERLRAGAALLMFPEGSRMRDGELHSARPGVGMMAVQADVPIVPAYVSGSHREKDWFTRGVRVRVTFGPARPWRELAGADSDLTPGRALYQRIGAAVMREIALLKAEQERSASRGAA